MMKFLGNAPAGSQVHAAQAVTDADFEETVLKSDLPVFVDFWAEWCGPCRLMAPVFERLAQQFAVKARFYKLDVDENPRTAERYGIQGIPTLIMFKGGKDAGRIVGFPGEAALQKAISRALGT
jgi:thioredoxin 1